MKPMPVRLILTAVSMAVGVALGCSSNGKPSPSPTGEPPNQSQAPDNPGTVQVSAPFDINTVINQARYAFRSESRGYNGGTDTLRVHVDNAGGITITPQQPNDSPDPSRATDPKAGTNPPSPRGSAVAATVRTTQIARGATSLLRQGLHPEASSDGGLDLAHDGAVEHLTSSEEGMEQSWRFASQPLGKGDLTVRVRVLGQDYAGDSPHGLHFVDPASGLGIRYGWATWVAGDGRRTSLPMTWSDGEVHITVPSEVVRASAYPAVLDPTISAEFGVDRPLMSATSGSATTHMPVAYGGGVYLVVWTANSTVYGTRVAPDGSVMFPNTSIRISGSSGKTEADPIVGFDGSNFLVVWRVKTVTDTEAYWSLLGARVTPSGIVLDTPFTIRSSSQWTQDQHTLAFDGTKYLIAYTDYSSAGAPYVSGVQVTKSGSVGSPFSICSTGKCGRPRIGFDGTNYLVAWNDNRTSSYYAEVYGTRVSPSGQVLDKNFGIATGASVAHKSPVVSFDGTNLLVIWTNSPSSSNLDLYVTRVSKDGAVLDPTGLLVTVKPEEPVSVVFDGTNHWVLVKDGSSGKYGVRRIKPDGSTVDVDALTSGMSSVAGLAFDGTGVLLVGDAIRGRRINSDGTFADSPFVIVGKANSAASPAVAFDGTNYWVTWADTRPTSSGYSNILSIQAARLTSAGSVLDPAGIAITSHGTEVNDSTPSIASSGSESLITWASKGSDGISTIWGARASPAGTLVDTKPFQISGASGTLPKVTRGAGQYLVAWEATGILAARVSAGGSVLDGTAISISAQKTAKAPALAFDGENYLLVWSVLNDTTKKYEVHATRINTSGQVVDPAGFAVSPGLSYATTPAVAFNGEEYLVGWIDGAGRITVSRVAKNATVLDMAGIQVSQGSDSSPGIAWDGGAYLIGWKRSSTSSSIFASRIAKSGKVLGSEFLVASEVGQFGVTAGEPSKVLFGFSRDYTVDGYKSTRVRGQSVTVDATGKTCTKEVDCLAGYCVDGVCCSTACSGACEACAASLKASGTEDGTCGHVKAGLEPHNGCEANGAACSIPADCASGYCVDGVCCSTACAGGCDACVASLKASGTEDGTCGPVKAGTDPHKGCKDDGSPFCQNNGMCDGSGTCQKYPTSTGCVPAPCTSNSECSSGFCVEGLCCDSKCDGVCSSCLAVKTGSGVDGECHPISAGSDPDNECAQDDGYPTSCKTDGNCDGSGKCRVFAVTGTACGGTWCNAGLQTGFQCNGAGLCVSGSYQCAPYACKGEVCASSCTSPSECQTGLICSDGACVHPGANGQACSSPGECTSGFCAGGVCCDGPCDGMCESCKGSEKASGSSGSCGPVKAGIDPKDKCPSDGSECGADGTCDGIGSCASAAPQTKLCGSPTCVGSLLAAKHCDGKGQCTTDAPAECAGGFKCHANTCPTTCANDDECATEFRCSKDTCVPRNEVGKSCAEDRECKSGFCVDQVCCEAPCTGQCEACDISGKLGKCTPVSGQPHGSREKCNSADPSCKGSCDGADTTECKYPANSTYCGNTSCQGSVFKPEVCDGHGACKPLNPQDCGDYACDSEAKTCKKQCVTSADCAAGSQCNNKQCTGAASHCNGDKLVTNDGAEVSCAPYRCKAGQCPSACASTAECAAGYSCANGKCEGTVDPSTGDASTPTAPAEGADSNSSGCGCSTTSRGPGAWISLIGLGVIVAVRKRRRRAA